MNYLKCTCVHCGKEFMVPETVHPALKEWCAMCWPVMLENKDKQAEVLE